MCQKERKEGRTFGYSILDKINGYTLYGGAEEYLIFFLKHKVFYIFSALVGNI